MKKTDEVTLPISEDYAVTILRSLVKTLSSNITSYNHAKYSLCKIKDIYDIEQTIINMKFMLLALKKFNGMIK